jgi:protein gp37
MGEGSKIQWTHHTFNPWWGCVRVSPGCERCYAETFSKRVGLKVWGAQADRRFFGDKHWNEPIKWNRRAVESGERHRVFCASMADVFEDRDDLIPHRARLWDLIAETRGLDWLILTKRPENVQRLTPNGLWPMNAWLGVTAEDQKRADDRISTLLTIDGPPVRFVSYEPALEYVDFFAFLKTPLRDESLAALKNPPMPGVDWIIVGGESGGKARGFNPTWAKEVVNQCRRAGVAAFVKQLGANVLDFAGAVKDRHGGDWTEWPEELRVRQFPEQRP